MKYPEFEQFEEVLDDENPLCNKYRTKDGHIFYVEPGFYYGMLGFKDKREEDYPKILEAIYKVVEENEHVVFTGNYETPFLDKEGYIYREISDISDPLCIFVEDKSRGSDYGD